MATDLLTTAAVGATTIEADAMPHRLLHLFPYPRAFVLGVFSGTGSLVASITNEQAMSMALAAVAIGTVLAQPLLKAYKAARDAKLEADTREFETWDGKLSSKSEQLGEALGRLKIAEDEIERLKRQNERHETELGRAKKLGKYAAKTASDLDKKVEDNAKRLESVELIQTSLSGDNLPATPVPPEPKAKPKA